jgi:hypothetical protein
MSIYFDIGRKALDVLERWLGLELEQGRDWVRVCSITEEGRSVFCMVLECI